MFHIKVCRLAPATKQNHKLKLICDQMISHCESELCVPDYCQWKQFMIALGFSLLSGLEGIAGRK